ncbi:HlyD family secretion protein [Pseudomonas panipatensis]|uniref:HlyD family secretion protein n=1 Tax=Pseudomonas panipatensis TaxID=428992 RepID=A0A1G8E279_9PSED|nr:efflux RND transporter periplasmic adaptor subunit [Pseudomonas panipatensis]SDH63994.1 HlyD family secretion protein [Pseudomonas panipatensis]SMP38812.1 HlyD family secretion protein [Pseudomonas panipatensis]
MKGWKLFAPLLILVIVAITLYLQLHTQPLLLQGEADATEVIVASKAKGRVEHLHVRRGDEVKKGDLLISLSSPELQAQLDSLRAARSQAQAQLDESVHGTREETLRALQASLQQAQAELRNAELDYQRNQELAARGFVSQSQLDLSRRGHDVARNQVAEAQANLDQGNRGDREETRKALSAAVRRADAQLAELEAQSDDLRVLAPVDGEVGPIPAEEGELINAYSPLLTLVRLSDSYLVFNLREDILAKVRKGDKVALQLPALGDARVEAEVRYIAPLGDFATKRATRATGDFDLKTFEVRLYPLQPVQGLRPGMSALWHWQQ